VPGQEQGETAADETAQDQEPEDACHVRHDGAWHSLSAIVRAMRCLQLHMTATSALCGAIPGGDRWTMAGPGTADGPPASSTAMHGGPVYDREDPMTTSLSPATLRVYRRADCHLCDEARHLLQVVLEERAVRGDPLPRVREIDITTEPGLEARYGDSVPVMAIGDHEVPLVTSARQIRAFLDRVIGRLA
jgi:hypothetical protein